MNKTLIKTRFSKATRTYEQEATAQRQIASTMTHIIKAYTTPGEVQSAIEVGCGTGIFSRMILNEIAPRRFLLNDICPEMENYLADILGNQVCFQAGDAETYPFAGQHHLITSCSTLQWFNSPEEFFDRCYSLLHPGGYLAFSTFGSQNMKEITALTGNSLPYRSITKLKEALKNKYEVLFSNEETIIKYFRAPIDVLLHMKKTGVTGVRNQVWTKSGINRFCEQYRHLFNTSKGVSLTYHPIYILAQKK